uniref:Secreted protein n=1 Tax=Amazona collaria TaxID=241587 RepID=A0A8B9FNX9_9PSIT
YAAHAVWNLIKIFLFPCHRCYCAVEVSTKTFNGSKHVPVPSDNTCTRINHSSVLFFSLNFTDFFSCMLHTFFSVTIYGITCPAFQVFIV